MSNSQAIPINATPEELVHYYRDHPNFFMRIVEAVETMTIDLEAYQEELTLKEEQVETLCDLYYEADEIIEVVQTLSWEEPDQITEARKSLLSIKELTNCPLEDFNGDFDHWYSVKYPTDAT